MNKKYTNIQDVSTSNLYKMLSLKQFQDDEHQKMIKDEDSWFVDVVSKDKYIVDEDFYSDYNDALITFKEAKKQIQKDERKYAIKTKANRI